MEGVSGLDFGDGAILLLQLLFDLNGVVICVFGVEHLVLGSVGPLGLVVDIHAELLAFTYLRLVFSGQQGDFLDYLINVLGNPDLVADILSFESTRLVKVGLLIEELLS